MGQLAAIAVLGKIEVPLMSVIVESSVLRMKPDIYDLFIVEPMDQLFGDQKTLVARILAYAKVKVHVCILNFSLEQKIVNRGTNIAVLKAVPVVQS